MSMSSAQISAFTAGAGTSPSAVSLLFMGACIAISLLWAAWALNSIYRGWVTRNISNSIAGSTVVRVAVLVMILSFFVLS